MLNEEIFQVYKPPFAILVGIPKDAAPKDVEILFEEWDAHTRKEVIYTDQLVNGAIQSLVPLTMNGNQLVPHTVWYADFKNEDQARQDYTLLEMKYYGTLLYAYRCQSKDRESLVTALKVHRELLEI